MNKHYIATLATLTGLLSAAAFAAPGEYWEVTSKMEMPGMPFAMPATTQKVCIPKGEQGNPEKTSGDKSCKMTDIKTVGNKTTWKARCDRDGEVMTGEGEQTTSANGYDGKMAFAGKSRGRDMNMAMSFSGKRIGGACDSEEQVKKFKSEVCDTSRYRNTAEWIGSTDLILQPGAACADLRKQFCGLVAKDAPNDVRTYNALMQHDQHMVLNGIVIANECKLNVGSITKSICKKLDADNYSQLSDSCPAEAKVFREEQRRRECEGRSYTAASDLKKCLNGKSDSADEPARETAAPQAAKGGSNPANDALEAAKKLRSRFGF